MPLLTGIFLWYWSLAIFTWFSEFYHTDLVPRHYNM